MVSKLLKTIELKFWDFMIPLLSRSTWMQRVFTKINTLYHDDNSMRGIAIGIVIAYAGFASGFLIFSISTLFS